MKRRNILFISPHFGRFGAEKSLIALITALKKEGNRVILVIPREGQITDLLNENDIEYIVSKFYNWINVRKGSRIIIGLGKFIYNRFQSYKLKTLLKTINFVPDIVHSNVIISDFGYHISKRLDVKHVWHIREFGKLDFNMNFDLGNYLTKRIFNSATIFIANSKAVQDYFISTGLVAPNKICFVHNGVESNKVFKHDFQSNPFKILLVGRIGMEKGQIDAINAIEILLQKEYTQIQLDLYGDGHNFEIKKLRTSIQNKKLEPYISMKGYRTNIEYGEYHLGLICSRNEAFGRVTVEYMLANLPVIASNSGGTPEIIDSTCGLLYPSKNSKKLAEQIEYLINNKDLCEELGSNGRKRALKLFSVQKYTDEIKNVYSTI